MPDVAACAWRSIPLALSPALYPLIPLGLLVAAFITFEIGMSLAISTMPFDPKRRSWGQWTAAEKARCKRMWLGSACVWPILILTLLVHLRAPRPIWIGWDLLLLAGLVMFLRWLGRGAQMRQWLREGRCGGCGYDMQGLAEDAKCPECGEGRAGEPTKRSEEDP